ncbi:NAD-dependent succinate-semialdehyde dehydrogenase [Caulobacter sp. LARHSG274]
MYADLKLLIDGQFLSGEGRASQPVFNPATGAVLADLPHASPGDLDRALDAAQRAFETWRKTAPQDRGRILKRGADLIRERIDAIARVMTLEQGKPLAESRGEILYAADVIEWYAEEGRRAYGRVIPAKTPGVRQLVLLEPVGVAVAFTPWNFPALTPARKIGGALAAGCTLILKAAEDTPGTAVEFARALQDAGLPPGVLNLVFGDPAAVSAHLIASPISRKVSFTGSVGVGKQLVRLASEDMKRTTMELGGHAPVIVFEDADPVAAATALAMGKYRNAGQVCISPTRFYVHGSILEPFTDRFVAVAQSLKLGDGTEDGVTMGPLVSSRRVEAMERLVADAVARGGVVRTGGARRGNVGSFFEPTVITDLPDDSLLMTEEPFGPIAPIVSFSGFDEVMARANALPFGLAAYAFTTSNATATAVGDGLKAGMVGVNTLAVSNPETPFGGVRHSGVGQEGGIEGLQAYFDVKFLAQA